MTHASRLVPTRPKRRGRVLKRRRKKHSSRLVPTRPKFVMSLAEPLPLFSEEKRGSDIWLGTSGFGFETRDECPSFQGVQNTRDEWLGRVVASQRLRELGTSGLRRERLSTRPRQSRVRDECRGGGVSHETHPSQNFTAPRGTA
jgi:hypothetical protein